MAPSPRNAVLASLVPLVLSIIAFAFAIAATTSKEWAIRHNYGTSLLVDWSKKTLSLTESRSPFTICELSVDSKDSLVCVNYGNVTGSCRPHHALGSGAFNDGDERLCQQISWAGNLAIASTTFIGLGFILTLSMSLVATLVLLSPAAISAEEQPEESSTTEAKSGSVIVVANRRPQPHRKHKYLSPMAPYINAVLVILFITGAILYVLAQAYGVLAFVQSNPTNGMWADGRVDNGDPNTVNSQGPWIQGKAVSVYASVAWFAAVLTALSAAWVWRLPSGRQSPL